MKYCLTFIFVTFAITVNAQKVALKTNLLYDATSTANLGVEIGLGKRTTLDLSGNYNAWEINREGNEKMRHFLVQPEFRYYFCEKMNGHFIGAHGLIGEYNVCGEQWLLSAFKGLSSLRNYSEDPSRYQGTGAGLGLVYGYSLMISKRLNLEFSVGTGYVHLDYDRYGPNKCSGLLGSDTKNYFGLTKLGISLVYIIK